MSNLAVVYAQRSERKQKGGFVKGRFIRNQEKGVLAKRVSVESSVTAKETKSTQGCWPQPREAWILQKPPSKTPLSWFLSLANTTLVPVFWYRGISECTLVPGFGTGEYPNVTSFGFWCWGTSAKTTLLETTPSVNRGESRLSQQTAGF